MSVEIVLVRHGESEGNRAKMFTGHSGSPLTARGHAQALAAGQGLRDFAPTRIVSSDLLRAWQTAEGLCAGLGRAHPVEANPAFRERDMGDWVGITFSALEARDPDGWAALVRRDPDHHPPAGETHRACAARVAAALDALLDGAKEERIVLVSHGVAISHMIRHLLQIAAFDVLFTVDNLSFHRFERRRTGTRVIALNDTRHLHTLRAI